MRKKTNAETIEIDGLELPINTHGGKYYCFEEPLPKIKRELDAMSYAEKTVQVNLVN